MHSGIVAFCLYGVRQSNQNLFILSSFCVCVCVCGSRPRSGCNTLAPLWPDNIYSCNGFFLMAVINSHQEGWKRLLVLFPLDISALQHYVLICLLPSFLFYSSWSWSVLMRSFSTSLVFSHCQDYSTVLMNIFLHLLLKINKMSSLL